MLHIVRRLSMVAIVALCIVIFAFAKAQQQARPAGQAAAAAQAAKDTCWGKTPCPEDHRPPVAFREDWTDATPGVPTDYKDKDLDAHLQNKNLTMVRYGAGAKDVIYDRHVEGRLANQTGWLQTTSPCPEADGRKFSHQRPLRWSGRRLEHLGNFDQRRPLENTQDPGARQDI